MVKRGIKRFHTHMLTISRSTVDRSVGLRRIIWITNTLLMNMNSSNTTQAAALVPLVSGVSSGQ